MLKSKIQKEKLPFLSQLDASIISFIEKYADLCQPDKIFIYTGTSEDKFYLRQKAKEYGEEALLNLSKHTIHFDGYYDQARDKLTTKYLVSEDADIDTALLNCIDKNFGIKEIMGFFENSMQGKEMIVGFFSLCPPGSIFSIPCLQITDSFYVAHSEDILYREASQQVLKQKTTIDNLFRFVHSAGELENNTSKNVDKRRVYIDLEGNIVYSVNTQYAGNTVGLKKPALRLAINKASKEGWLAEHMFLMEVNGKNGRKSYFTGAFPSACGKTSTSMLKGESVLGDDIAHLRIKNGKVFAANVEKGIFGIIQDINEKDDPEIWRVLHSPDEEVIFSNVLVSQGQPFWQGKGNIPEKGVNFSGEWFLGKTDNQGNEIPPAHKNARFTINIASLRNASPLFDYPEGVEVSGIIYGGRDSDTSVPVEESFSWQHGIITKAASLESETTAATLGQEGVRKFNPMSNLDFLSVPLAKYIENNLNFGSRVKNPPRIFSVNYFLKSNNGKYLNSIEDKRVWIKWMEKRVHNEIGSLKSPSGYIPEYEDLKLLFREVLNREYSKEDYKKQFTIRVKENIEKIGRILKIYSNEIKNIPSVVIDVLSQQKQRFESLKKSAGDYVSPFELSKE